MNTVRTFTYNIPFKYDNLTVYDYLIRIQGVSRRIIIKLKQSDIGLILNNVHVRTIDRVHTNDILTINIEERENILESIICHQDVKILYEDMDLIVYDKPADMPCHQSKRHQSATLANVFAGYCVENGISLPFRAINRLDRNTSGIVVVAKNAYCAGQLHGQIDKEYFAICQGKILENGIINAPIARLNEKSTIRVVKSDGQFAKTEYFVLNSTSEFSYLKVKIFTGRTHQIRVHFSHIGHPLCGDDLYGGNLRLISRQALHCGNVKFLHPVTQKKIELTAPLPDDMKSLLTFLEKDV